MKKLSAFTLAEVLITLGVIGIVAAMTMPSLIANYQKKVWVNQLKKSVSVLEQGFRKMLADEGVDSLLDTKAWTDNTVSYNLCDYLGAGDCLGIENGLKTAGAWFGFGVALDLISRNVCFSKSPMKNSIAINSIIASTAGAASSLSSVKKNKNV